MPTTKSQLTHEDVTNLVVNEALTKISQLSGLSQQGAFALLAKQVNDNYPLNRTAKHTPTLDHNEFKFISGLFN